MAEDFKHNFSHVLWIGGATDAGKTTVSQLLARRYGLQRYHYDQHDLRHHERLAQNSAHYRAFLAASLDERWVRPEPEDLLQRSLQSFRDRFPLMMEDLLALAKEPGVVAEGFGLMPQLVAPVLISQRQAIWLVPTPGFKLASMQRRKKPSFQDQISDVERATQNLLKRDMQLAELVRTQAHAYGFRVYEVGESHSVQELVAVIAQHFEPFLSGRNSAA